MIATEEQMVSFLLASRPLIRWMRKNAHPRCTAIVTDNRAELVEEIMGVPADEFLDEEIVRMPCRNDTSRPIQPKRMIPMDFRDKCRVVADGGELAVSTKWCLKLFSETTDFAKATHYRTSPNAEWRPCEKEVEE